MYTGSLISIGDLEAIRNMRGIDGASKRKEVGIGIGHEKSQD